MRVLVAGVGNVLKGDDGFGVRTAEAIARHVDLPEHATVLETGIGGIHLVQELQLGYDALILIDAMDRGGTPGELFLVEPILPDLEAMSERERRDFFADVHYATPVRAMSLARAIGVLPPVVRIVGCQPGDAESFGHGLGRPVLEAVPRAVDLIVSLLGKLNAGGAP